MLFKCGSMYESEDSKSIFCNMNAGCVLEESDVATPELLQRLDSKNARQYRLKTLQKEASEENEPLLGIVKQPSHFPYSKLLILIVVWLAFFAVQVLRGGKSSPVSLLTRKPLPHESRGLQFDDN